VNRPSRSSRLIRALGWTLLVVLIPAELLGLAVVLVCEGVNRMFGIGRSEDEKEHGD
jgi:hypothetical protein